MNTSPDKNGDLKLMRRARALHEQACGHIDARTRAELAAARRRALAAGNRHRHRAIWLPTAGAVAACALAIGVIWFRPQQVAAPSASGGPTAGEAELPLDADSQQLDLYQNLDFYQWLAQRPRLSAGSRGGVR